MLLNDIELEDGLCNVEPFFNTHFGIFDFDPKHFFKILILNLSFYL